MVINVGRLAPKKTGDVSREHTFVMILLYIYICHSLILPREMLDTAVCLICSAAAPALLSPALKQQNLCWAKKDLYLQ